LVHQLQRKHIMHSKLLKSSLISGLFLFVLLLPEVQAQVTNMPTPQEVTKLLNDNNITEAEFQAAMLDRGYDPNNIDIKTVDLAELERVSLEVISELSAAKQELLEQEAKEIIEDVSAETAESIQESIDKGASPEEAVSEELQNLSNEELPKSRIYGQHLFRNKDMTVFRQADRIKPPASYVLGVGDVLSITINGLSQLSVSTTIDENGYISIDQGTSDKPSIPVRGLTLEQAEQFLSRRLKAFYSFSDNQFHLNVLTTRTVTVNFFGEVMTTGGITLSAVNTLFNALVAAGGPSDIGSVRNIKLISGSEEKTFDTYAYMQDPRVVGNFYLKDNDYIHIPVAQRVVSITGEVRRPFRYELLEGENLLKLIDFAGGLTDGAYLKDIQITRYSNDQRVVVNVNLREILNSGGDYLLEPGDEIVIQSVEGKIINVVELQGAVVKPGQYQHKPGMRISDLIDLGVLEPGARLDFGYLLRMKPDNTYNYMRINPQAALDGRGGVADLLLSDHDILRIPSLVLYSDAVEFTVRGAVRAPGPYDFDPAGVLTIQDAMLISGGLKPSASEFGYILRRSPDNPKRVDYLPFNPQNAAADASSLDNLTMMPFDSLVVFDDAQLRDEFFIQVRGSVRNPGKYRYDANMTLEQALRLAGGLTFSAASNRVDVARVIMAENQPTRTVSYSTTVGSDFISKGADSSMLLFPFDEIFVRDVPQFELQKIVQINGEVQYPGRYAIVEENEKLASVIARAGGLTPEAYSLGAGMVRIQNNTGVIVINLDDALANPNSSANLILQAGDIVTIPKQPDLVTITGAVNLRDLYTEEYLLAGNKVNVAFEKGKSAKYYVDNYAAGLAEDGRKRLITVVQANGRVEKTKSFLFFKFYPKVDKGAVVNVGRIESKPDEIPGQKEEIDWGIVVRDTLAQATAILTLILLVDRL
jgi:protein involved in polysaccharide export with SLBB domain